MGSTELTTHRATRSWRTRRFGMTLVRYLFAISLALIFAMPFIWAVFSSLKAPHEIYIFPPRWLPEIPQWHNYVEIFRLAPLGKFAWNTLVITALSVIGQISTATLVAYGFARYEFPGRNVLFMVLISTLILPSEVMLIPRFALFRALGWLDTYKPLIVPAYFGGGAFTIFLLRQFILTLPRDLDEAAELDGAGSLQILWRVLVPLMKPALATVTILSFLGHWNDFMSPLIYLRTTEKFTLQLGLRYFMQTADTGGAPTEALLMAASLIVAAPCIVIFLLAQRYFVRGVVMSGLKG